MLERIRVRGFKSLADVEVRLTPLVVLLGPNAAGKSNFLEALLLLSRLGTERTLSEAFESGLRGYPLEAFSLPEEGLPALLRQETAQLSLEADVVCGEVPHRRRLRYRVGVEIHPKSGSLSVFDELLTALGRSAEQKLPRIEREEARGDSSRPHLAVRQLGRGGRPIYEQVGLGHTQLSNLQLSGETRYPDFDRLRAELAAWRIYYLDPRDAMRIAQPPREVSDIGERGELIGPYLHRLQGDDPRAFDAVRRGLAQLLPIEELDVDLDDKRGTLDVEVVQAGTPFSSRVVSEGTLRVLALCAIAANPWRRTLVAFEEPENGVHPRRIEAVARLLVNVARRGRQQLVLTTHSPAFAAAVARLREELDLQEEVSLLTVATRDRETVVSPLELDLPLLRDVEISDALRDPDEELLLSELYSRGWLDA